MDVELIKDNLEIIRMYLSINLETFSLLGGRSASYYRNKIDDDKLPDLDFIYKISVTANVNMSDIIGKKLKLSIEVL